MKPAQVRSLFLDLGRVLIDFDHRHFADRMESLTGLSEAELSAAVIGNGLVRKYELGLLETTEFCSEISRRLGIPVSLEEFASAWNSIFFEESLLTEDLISAIASRQPLYIVSNTNEMHFEFINNRYPLMKHFTGCILSYRVGAAKPDPEIYRRALVEAGVQPSQVLFVERMICLAMLKQPESWGSMRFSSWDPSISNSSSNPGTFS